MKDLIIDTDPGNRAPAADIDDALAIATALLSPEVTLLGLTTVAGNATLPDATEGALELLAFAGRTDIPVYQGAARPIIADPTPVRAALDGRGDSELAQRLWTHPPRPAPTQRPNPRRAAEFIVETVMARPGQVALVALGPLTNVAIAMLLEPRLAAAVQEVVVMGGAVSSPGLLTPATELNVGYDPEAAHIVLRSGAPITMVTLDVTRRTFLSLVDLARLRAVGSPLTDYLCEIADPWVSYVMERRGLPGCWLHDPLAVCVAIDPSLVRTEPMYVEVELASPRLRGQTVAWGQGFPYAFLGGKPNARVSVDVDNARFMPLLLGTLGVQG